MSKTWRIVIIALVAVAIVAIVAAKSQQNRSERQSPTPTVASKPDSAKPATTETPKTEPPVPTPSQETKPPVATQATKPVPKPDRPAATSPVSPPKAAAPRRLPKLVDVGSESCIPCKMMLGVMEDLKKEYPGRLEIVFIDKANDPKAAEKLGVKLIPTQILYDARGKEISRHVGFYPKDEIVAEFARKGVKL